jgi:hypothetical protein
MKAPVKNEGVDSAIDLTPQATPNATPLFKGVKLLFHARVFRNYSIYGPGKPISKEDYIFLFTIGDGHPLI